VMSPYFFGAYEDLPGETVSAQDFLFHETTHLVGRAVEQEGNLPYAKEAPQRVASRQGGIGSGGHGPLGWHVRPDACLQAVVENRGVLGSPLTKFGLNPISRAVTVVADTNRNV
jgi:hypothetical protein